MSIWIILNNIVWTYKNLFFVTFDPLYHTFTSIKEIRKELVKHNFNIFLQLNVKPNFKIIFA